MIIKKKKDKINNLYLFKKHVKVFLMGWHHSGELHLLTSIGRLDMCVLFFISKVLVCVCVFLKDYIQSILSFYK